MADSLALPDDVGDVLTKLRSQYSAPQPATPPPSPVQTASLSSPPASPPTGGGMFPSQVQTESGGQQFDKNGQPLVSYKFVNDPDIWNQPTGVSQAKPSTAKNFVPNFDINRFRNDPQYNRMVGDTIMAAYQKQYGGSQALAEAAYDAGPQRVDEWLKEYGDPRQGKISYEDWAAKIPNAETQAYLLKTGAVHSLGNQPQRDPANLPYDPNNIFKELQDKQFGALKEADADLAELRTAMKKMEEPLPQIQQRSPMEGWGAVAMSIAALGGLLTHTPVTTALNAAAGVMNAMKKSDTDEAKEQLDRWKLSNNAALKAVDVQLKLYSDAMSRYSTAPEQAKAELAANAAAMGNQAMLDMLNKGDLNGALAIANGTYIQAQEFKLRTAQFEQVQQDRITAADAITKLRKVRDDPNATPEQKAAAEQDFRDTMATVKGSAPAVNIVQPKETMEYTKPSVVTVAGPNGPEYKLAQQNKGTGQWMSADETRTPFEGVTSVQSSSDMQDPNDPSIKQAAHAIANYQLPPLSGFVLKSPWGHQVFAEITKENPTYAAERYTEISKALRDFGTGTQGTRITSINVAVGHLGTLRELAEALQNGDVRTLNELYQRIAQETGQPQPTSFDAAKQIIGQEITKAVVNSGGGVTERQAAGEQLDRSSSPAQILGPNGVIDTYRKLLGSQMSGLQRQYDQTVGRWLPQGSTDFGGMVAPETEKFLHGGSQADLPAEAKAKLKQGTLTHFSNGQVWTLGTDGVPRQVQ